MSDKQSERISRQNDADLTQEERQEHRYIGTKLLRDDSFDIERLGETQKKVDDLHNFFGFIPDFFRSWPKILVAIGVAAFVGGEALIANVVKFLEKFAP